MRHHHSNETAYLKVLSNICLQPSTVTQSHCLGFRTQRGVCLRRRWWFAASHTERMWSHRNATAMDRFVSECSRSSSSGKSARTSGGLHYVRPGLEGRQLPTARWRQDPGYMSWVLGGNTARLPASPWSTSQIQRFRCFSVVSNSDLAMDEERSRASMESGPTNADARGQPVRQCSPLLAALSIIVTALWREDTQAPVTKMATSSKCRHQIPAVTEDSHGTSFPLLTLFSRCAAACFANSLGHDLKDSRNQPKHTLSYISVFFFNWCFVLLIMKYKGQSNCNNDKWYVSQPNKLGSPHPILSSGSRNSQPTIGVNDGVCDFSGSGLLSVNYGQVQTLTEI